ncbi:hypothetical protein MTQ10_29820 [Streptomyces sp. XM83C]|uniref:Uncharacterized protein n=1 Tax=Streptomyces thermocoprophilus TaxID=78356 RepID=A0ABV5VDN2_9ACTN|nr:hypothetical protein [Streptomyces sp. XM83C]MCK1823668.1 hypothetical protein [Streptomyces sp. XM83C]
MNDQHVTGRTSRTGRTRRVGRRPGHGRRRATLLAAGLATLALGLSGQFTDPPGNATVTTSRPGTTAHPPSEPGPGASP